MEASEDEQTAETVKSRLIRMPKTELHVHIEGACPPSLFWEFARRNRVELPAKSPREWEALFAFKDFNHFIEVYQLATSCLRTEDDYYSLVLEFHRHQAEANIVWTEAFISLSHLPQSMDKMDFLHAVRRAMIDGKEKHGVEVEIIGDIARHMPESQSEALGLILAGKEMSVFSGIGLGGIEKGFPPRLFLDSFAAAREAGLSAYVHAGETMDASYVRDSINELEARRIGHGIRVLEDPDLVDELAAKGIPFEVCPTSNYATGVVSWPDIHPIREMADTGLNCTVNSDDPAMFSTSLGNEYLLLSSQGFSWNELWDLNIATLKAANLDSLRKPLIHQVYNDFLIEEGLA